MVSLYDSGFKGYRFLKRSSQILKLVSFCDQLWSKMKIYFCTFTLLQLKWIHLDNLSNKRAKVCFKKLRTWGSEKIILRFALDLLAKPFRVSLAKKVWEPLLNALWYIFFFHFQMIHAIQVLRMHLLEMEKVNLWIIIFSYWIDFYFDCVIVFLDWFCLEPVTLLDFWT